MYIEESIEELLYENIHLLNKINTTKSNKCLIESLIMLEIDKFVADEKDRYELMRALDMRVGVLYEMYEPIKKECVTFGREEGVVIGREEANREWINNLIAKNYTLEEIEDISGLSQEKISEIINNK